MKKFTKFQNFIVQKFQNFMTYKNFKISKLIYGLTKISKFHDLQKFQNFMTYKNFKIS